MSQPPPSPHSQASVPPPETVSSKATPAGVQVEAIAEEDGISQKRLFFNILPGWLVSFIAHMIVIILLAIYMLPTIQERKVALETGQAAAALDDRIDLNLDLNLDEEILEESELVEEVAPDFSEAIDTPVMLESADFGEILGADFSVESDSLTEISNFDSLSEVSSRSESSKQDLLKKYGGSAASEEAVALALKWIIAHQLDDGGWSFDHRIGPGNHRTSPDPGQLADARNGATAIALLPLLGAGQTHRTGEYRQQIEKGLKFLIGRAKASGRGISYWEQGGTMYSHGLAAIVFNEAYAMTNDPVLAPFAQRTLYFIEDSQDPVGGGWRYQPRERGDTSVVGWQLMALKSGFATGMKLNPNTIRLTEKFLDTVSSSGGAFYGYLDPPRGKPADARTAIGLLCRMYLGWSREAPGMVDGIEVLAERGPRMGEAQDMYYNYYATQLMKHYGDKHWKEWNDVMRDSLVRAQIKEGPAAGSWNPRSQHGDVKGGRLYVTALACMTLEVYYRYLPLYADDAIQEEFRLD